MYNCVDCDQPIIRWGNNWVHDDVDLDDNHAARRRYTEDELIAKINAAVAAMPRELQEKAERIFAFPVNLEGVAESKEGLWETLQRRLLEDD